MDFSQHLQKWANGDILQGKIMAAAGVVIGFFIFYIFQNENPILNGMLVPMILLFLAFAGYGGFLLSSRPKHILATQESFQKDAKSVIKKELEKAENDHKAYSTLKPIWIGLLVISVVLWFYFSDEYWKGVSLGLIVMSIGGYLLDTFFNSP